MNQGSVILGNHAYFFRDGDAFTVPAPGTAGRTSKPGATDTGWIDLGILTDLEPEKKADERDVFAPAPGAIRLYDKIETKRQLGIKLTGIEMDPLKWELLFGTLPLSTGSTQYNPLEGVTKKGWLKIQQYKQDDTLFNTLDVYVHLKVAGGVKFDDNIVTANLEASVLHSTLNTGTIA